MANRTETRAAHDADQPLRDFRLADHIGYLLRRAYVRAERSAAEVIPAPFHVRELAILSMLETRGALSQQQLAELGRVNRTIMVRLIDGMEARGLVRRERNPLDRRSYALVATIEGHAALRELAPTLAEGDALLTASLTATESKRLAALLRQLLDGTPAMGGGPLTRRIGYLITHAHFQLRARARAALSPLGLDPRDLGALASIARLQPCSQQAVAAGLGVSAPVVAKLIDELDEAGLVDRVRNAQDRRLYDLRLSALGERQLTDAVRVANEIAAAVCELLGEKGAADLRRLLTKLVGLPPQ